MSSLVLGTNLTTGANGLPTLDVPLYEKVKESNPKLYNSDRSVPTLRVPFKEDGNIDDGPNLILWSRTAPFADGKATPATGAQWYIDREVKEGKNVRYFSHVVAKHAEGKTIDDMKAKMVAIVKYDCFAKEKEVLAEEAQVRIEALRAEHQAQMDAEAGTEALTNQEMKAIQLNADGKPLNAKMQKAFDSATAKQTA